MGVVMRNYSSEPIPNEVRVFCTCVFTAYSHTHQFCHRNTSLQTWCSCLTGQCFSATISVLPCAHETQIRTLVEAGYHSLGKCPVLIGECGILMDMNCCASFKTDD